MDERLTAPPGQEHLPPVGGGAAPAEASPTREAGPLDDPRLLQILSTEHWSLLSARSLVYNEAFARAGMFLTFLSASLVALGFLASAMALGRDFLLVALLLLTLDLVIGLATVGRILDATIDDLRAIQGMNRIRNAYVRITPAALPYFISSIHDDARGVLATYGEPETRGPVMSFIHGMTTTSSMVSTIVAILAGVDVADLALLAGAASEVATGAGIVAFAIVFFGNSHYALVAIRRFEAEMDAQFPTPTDEVTTAPGKR